MKHIASIWANEKGSALVLALLILVLLTLMGISATTTSTIEVQMAGSEKFYELAFYSAESGWQRALNWLDGQYPGPIEKLGWDDTTKTYTADNFEAPNAFPLAEDNNTEYYVTIEFVGTTPVPGYDTNFRRVNYRISSEGGVTPSSTHPGKARSVVEVTAGKVFDMGG